jgi:phenylalanine-4-hydroxylase
VGICRQDGENRVYGAAILSSYKELQTSLSDQPTIEEFEPALVSAYNYSDRDLQPVLFVVDSLDTMMSKMRQYVANVDRPFDAQYNPYTQTIETTETTSALAQAASSLQDNVDKLLRTINAVSKKL